LSKARQAHLEQETRTYSLSEEIFMSLIKMGKGSNSSSAISRYNSGKLKKLIRMGWTKVESQRLMSRGISLNVAKSAMNTRKRGV
jgi:hypothetical protein